VGAKPDSIGAHGVPTRYRVVVLTVSKNVSWMLKNRTWSGQ